MATAFLEEAVDVGKETRQAKLDGFKVEHDTVSRFTAIFPCFFPPLLPLLSSTFSIYI